MRNEYLRGGAPYVMYDGTDAGRNAAMLQAQQRADLQNSRSQAFGGIAGSLASQYSPATDTVTRPLDAIPPLSDPEKEFIARNLIRSAQNELDAAVKRANVHETAASRANRIAQDTEAALQAVIAERDELRRQQRARMPDLRKRLYGHMWERMNAAHAGVIPNNLWLATSIALVLAGVVVML